MAKLAIFLQNMIWEICSTFDFEQCSLKKIVKILIFKAGIIIIMMIIIMIIMI